MDCCHQKGLTDWHLQRGTTVFISSYIMPMIIYWLVYPQASLSEWQQFLTSWPMLVAAIVGLFALAVHAYIGIWVVLTDYLSDHLSAQSSCISMLALRKFLIGLMGIWVFGSVLVALAIIVGWGIL